jgi:uncharacterized protein YbjT (DUF2867 family)
LYDLARYNTAFFLSTIRQSGEFYSTLGNGRVAMVDEEDVAAVAAEALTESRHEGKTYTLTDPQALSYGEIAKLITDHLQQDVRYVDGARRRSLHHCL